MTQTPLPSPPLDPNYVFSETLPVVAVIAVIIVVAIALRWVFRSPVGEALAERIRHGRKGSSHPADGSPDTARLEDRVAELQEQVGELAERLDFTERLLAGQRDRPLLRGE